MTWIMGCTLFSGVDGTLLGIWSFFQDVHPSLHGLSATWARGAPAASVHAPTILSPPRQQETAPTSLQALVLLSRCIITLAVVWKPRRRHTCPKHPRLGMCGHTVVVSHFAYQLHAAPQTAQPQRVTSTPCAATCDTELAWPSRTAPTAPSPTKLSSRIISAEPDMDFLNDKECITRPEKCYTKRNMVDTHPFLRDGSATTDTVSRGRTLDGLRRTS